MARRDCCDNVGLGVVESWMEVIHKWHRPSFEISHERHCTVRWTLVWLVQRGPESCISD